VKTNDGLEEDVQVAVADVENRDESERKGW
jgi:hypothetical protein